MELEIENAAIIVPFLQNIKQTLSRNQGHQQVSSSLMNSSRNV